MANDHDLLIRIDGCVQAVQADVKEIKAVMSADHDALLVLTGKQQTDVEMLKGKIKNTNIWQGLGTAIGTFIGSLFAFGNKP